VAGRIDEGDAVAAFGEDLVGADVLGDAAGFLGGDVGLTAWVMVAMTPSFISALMTSAPRTAMRLASSWTVI
jgi:hypothetical protein